MNKHRQLAIEKKAEQVRNECKIIDYGFLNIFESVEKLGYRMIRYPIGIDTFLGFALIKDTERIIFSNSSLVLSREIFTAAHEVGHQELHLSEQGQTMIKDDDFEETDESEKEANYFAACLLMPAEKVEKFIHFELNDKSVSAWNGLDIARIQSAFNVSYEMTIVRLRSIGIINESLFEKLKLEKVERTASRLLKAINGNIDLCKAADVKRVPAEYLDWVISNYNEKLIPVKSLEVALNYVDLKAEDFQSDLEMT